MGKNPKAGFEFRNGACDAVQAFRAVAQTAGQHRRTQAAKLIMSRRTMKELARATMADLGTVLSSQSPTGEFSSSPLMPIQLSIRLRSFKGLRRLAVQTVDAECETANAAANQAFRRISRWPHTDVGVEGGEVEAHVRHDQIDGDVRVELAKLGQLFDDYAAGDRVCCRQGDGTGKAGVLAENCALYAMYGAIYVADGFEQRVRLPRSVGSPSDGVRRV